MYHKYNIITKMIMIIAIRFIIIIVIKMIIHIIILTISTGKKY